MNQSQQPEMSEVQNPKLAPDRGILLLKIIASCMVLVPPDLQALANINNELTSPTPTLLDDA
jgi:hypothetical protein